MYKEWLVNVCYWETGGFVSMFVYTKQADLLIMKGIFFFWNPVHYLKYPNQTIVLSVCDKNQI